MRRSTIVGIAGAFAATTTLLAVAAAAAPESCCFAEGHGAWSYEQSFITDGALYTQSMQVAEREGLAYSKSITRRPGQPDFISVQWAVRHRDGAITEYLISSENPQECFPKLAYRNHSYLFDPLCLEFGTNGGENFEVTKTTIAGQNAVLVTDMSSSNMTAVVLTLLTEHCVPIALSSSAHDSRDKTSPSFSSIFTAQNAGHATMPPVPSICLQHRAVDAHAASAPSFLPATIADVMRGLFARERAQK